MSTLKTVPVHPDPSGFNSQAALAKDAHGLAAHLRQKIVQLGVRGRLRPSRELVDQERFHSALPVRQHLKVPGDALGPAACRGHRRRAPQKGRRTSCRPLAPDLDNVMVDILAGLRQAPSLSWESPLRAGSPALCLGVLLVPQPAPVHLECAALCRAGVLQAWRVRAAFQFSAYYSVGVGSQRQESKTSPRPARSSCLHNQAAVELVELAFETSALLTALPRSRSQSHELCVPGPLWAAEPPATSLPAQGSGPWALNPCCKVTCSARRPAVSTYALPDDEMVADNLAWRSLRATDNC